MFDFCQKHFLIYMEKLKEWASKRAEEMKKQTKKIKRKKFLPVNNQAGQQKLAELLSA